MWYAIVVFEIEFFGESLPQTVLQSYMFYAGVNINQADLIISLSVSVFNLFYNYYQIRKRAKFHGMSITEYGISVLQLGQYII